MSENKPRNLEILNGQAVDDIGERLADVITGQASPLEQIATIQESLTNEDSIELFGDIWNELCPELSKLDPYDTLKQLLVLATARNIVEGIPGNRPVQYDPQVLLQIVDDQGLQEWLKIEARSYLRPDRIEKLRNLDSLDSRMDDPSRAQEPPTESDLRSLILGESSLRERLDLITLTLSRPDHIELFGNVWDELRPGEQGLDSQTTLTQLRELFESILSGPEQLQILASRASNPGWLTAEARSYRRAMLSGDIAPISGVNNWIAAPLGTRVGSELSPWARFQQKFRALKSQAVRSLIDILPRKIGGALDDRFDASNLFFSTSHEAADRYSAWRSVLVQGSVKVEVVDRGHNGYQVTVTYDASSKVREAAMVMTFRNDEANEEFSTVTYLERGRNGLWSGTIPANATEVRPGISLVNTQVIFRET